LGTLIIGLQGYLSLWTLTTLLDTQKTLEHLAYMGYTFHAGEENQINALTIANERKVDLGTSHILRNHFLEGGSKTSKNFQNIFQKINNIKIVQKYPKMC